MKNLLKSILIVLTALTLTQTVQAQGNYNTGAFNGSYYGGGRSDPIARTELSINNYYFVGTAFRPSPASGYTYFYGYNVDTAGNFTGYYYDSGNVYSKKPATAARNYGFGTVSGHAYGSLIVLKFSGDTINSTTILFKGYGMAPYFLSGREIDFYSNSGYGYLYFDYYNVGEVYIHNHFNNGKDHYSYLPYTYRITGQNSGTVTVAGYGVFNINFNTSYGNGWNGTATYNSQSYTTFMYDFGNDN